MLTAQHLLRALEKAAASEFRTTMSLKDLHKMRSRTWVARCAEEMHTLYPAPNVAVFTRHDERNRERFGLAELLYDISICETAVLKSPGLGKNLHYITKALWQIESELAEGDSTEWVKDFNKLVIGGAENKMFIGPEMQENCRNSFLPIAKQCSGAVYLAAIPHPRMWIPSALHVSLWKLCDGCWASCG